jgi:hypothetical protein
MIFVISPDGSGRNIEVAPHDAFEFAKVRLAFKVKSFRP